MKKNDIEDLFKESFEDFEADVNPGVWKNVQTAMKGAGLGFFGKMLLNKIGTNTLVAIVSSAATVVGTVLVMNGTKTETVSPKKTDAPKVVAEAAKPSVNEIKDFLKTDNGAPAIKENPAKNDAAEKTDAEMPSNANPKQIQKLIKSLSEDRVASISSDIVSGSVPLIVNLSNNGTGKTNKWTFNDGSKPLTGTNPVKVFDTPGIYTIMLTSTGTDGKTAIDSVKVEVYGNSSMMDGPEDFSPNGDGVRDEFKFNPINMVSLEATVANKGGKIVFHSTKVDAKWDGKTPKGDLAPAGEYYYILSAVGVDGKKYKKQGKIKLTR
jgi:gliding motility-associated-like protein